MIMYLKLYNLLKNIEKSTERVLKGRKNDNVQCECPSIVGPL